MWDSYLRRKQAENPRPYAPVIQIEGQRAEYRQVDDAPAGSIPSVLPSPATLPPDVETLVQASARLGIGTKRLRRALESGRVPGAYRLMYLPGEGPQWVIPRGLVIDVEALPRPRSQRPAAPRATPPASVGSPLAAPADAEPVEEPADAEPTTSAPEPAPAAPAPPAAPPPRPLDDRDVRVASLEAEVGGLQRLLDEKDRRIADLKQLLDFATRPAIEGRSERTAYMPPEPAPGWSSPPARDEPLAGEAPQETPDSLAAQIAQLADLARALTRLPAETDETGPLVPSAFTEIALGEQPPREPPDPFVPPAAMPASASPAASPAPVAEPARDAPIAPPAEAIEIPAASSAVTDGPPSTAAVPASGPIAPASGSVGVDAGLDAFVDGVHSLVGNDASGAPPPDRWTARADGPSAEPPTAAGFRLSRWLQALRRPTAQEPGKRSV